MNRAPLLFVGIFFTFTFAWIGLVMTPYFQVGRMERFVDEDTDKEFPPPLSGLALHGRKVYAASGCIYCHSQQVRGETEGADIARGWGGRRSVARDYIGEKPVFLGTMRTGPDLTNVGRRLSDADWHYRHFYNPRSIYAESLMPSFRWLLIKRKISGQPSADALKFTGKFALEPGWEIVPTYDARALVAYLLALDRNYSLPEAPME